MFDNNGCWVPAEREVVAVVRTTRLRWSVRSRTSAPLVCMWREYLENGEVVDGQMLFSWWPHWLRRLDVLRSVRRLDPATVQVEPALLLRLAEYAEGYGDATFHVALEDDDDYRANRFYAKADDAHDAAVAALRILHMAWHGI